MPARRRTRPRGSTRGGAPPFSRRRGKRSSASPGRLVSLFVVSMLAFAGVAARLVAVQIADASAYARLAEEQREREIKIPARRGAVFDRDGTALALSADMDSIYADPALIDDPGDTARKLARALQLDAVEVEKKLRGTRPGSRFEYIARQVPPRAARRVGALKLPGIAMTTEPKRLYPNKSVASHVLGFVNGFEQTGASGVELEYERILQGEPGRMVLEEDPAGRPLPQAEFGYETSRPGRSLFLTIDKDLQYFTETTLADAVARYRADGGSAIVMRPATGEILALANAPDFNPNEPGRFEPEKWRNRALTDVYEPGSAFKIVTLAAALEERVVTSRTEYQVPDRIHYSDRVFRDSHPHPEETMTVGKIIEQSSNVGTIKMGLDLGGKKLDEYVRKFGFGTSTGLDFPGESKGIVLDRDDWSGSTIATIPIGQGVAVTPMQMAAAYGAIANRGVWTEPKLLHAIQDPEGKTKRSPEASRRRVVSRRTARRVSRILERVVSQGTGIEAQIPGYRVAGKTGTAQKPLPTGGYGNSYVSSFGGFAPARHPEIMTLVVLDEPRPIWGGSTAAPTFKTIMEFALRHLGVAPTGNAERAARVIEESHADQTPVHD
jgi:cell division protein FtsI (penicillin-binding protein 3)